jgi:hypothetical protein
MVTHWMSEGRKRQAAVMKAKEALRFKQIFKSPTGAKQSTVDEEKAVAVALRRFAEAEARMANVKKWIRQLHKEAHIYRGSVQRLATTVSTDVPNAAAKISRMVMALEGYVAIAAPSMAPAIESGDGGSVSRGSAGPDQIGLDYKNLRHRTPAGPAKDAAPDADASIPWTSGEFAPTDAAKLARLPADTDPLDPAASVILAADVQTAKRIYLERSASSFPGDSGWYIGSADGPAATVYAAIRINDLLKARPQFSSLLSFPIGSLIVIDAAGVAGVLNRDDQDLWDFDIEP